MTRLRMKALIKSLMLSWLQKNCAAFFSVYSKPIHQSCSIENCLVLDTSKLDFWKRERRIFVSISPFKPYEQFEPVAAYVQDGTLLDHLGTDGLREDREHLHIRLLLKEVDSDKYYISAIDYLPDTRKSFASSLQSVGDHQLAQVAFDRGQSVVLEFCQNPLFHVLDHLSKPTKLDNLKFKVGLKFKHWINHIDLPEFDIWRVQVASLAQDKGMLTDYRYTGCKPEYWTELYNAGYKANQAFIIGTNPDNWSGEY